MKRAPRNPQKFEIPRVLDAFARMRGFDIRDPACAEAFLADTGLQLKANQKNDALFHGQRVETMFAYVAAALGGCRIIKSEDSGDVYSPDQSLQPPDFRIVTSTGRQVLIEVKNCHLAKPDRPLQLADTYVEGLRRYAKQFRTQLLFAIYWSRIRMWTLLALDDLTQRPPKYTVTMMEALKRNRMHVLGDRMIGTVPSLTFRVTPDPSKPRTIDDQGHARFVIGSAEIYCGAQRIDEPIEQQLAWFLMMNGNWQESDWIPEIRNGELIAARIQVSPEQRSNPEQAFEIVGHLSALISRQFTEVTASGGEVRLLSPKSDPDAFGVLIPRDYKGSVLKLWQFKLRPHGTRDQPAK